MEMGESPVPGATGRRTRTRRTRCRFDGMAGWRHGDYALTHDAHSYIRHEAIDLRRDIEEVVRRNVIRWLAEGCHASEIRLAARSLRSALARGRRA